MTASTKNGRPMTPSQPDKTPAPYRAETASLLLAAIAFALAVCVLCVLCAVRIRCPL